MTIFVVFEFLWAIITMGVGLASVRRRTVDAISESSHKVLHHVKGWEASAIGVGTFAFGTVLMLDAIGAMK